mgnify:FL=1|tara:strand:+ start:465 stop:2102 length:1638 start_codon:yes stop_codon:yes gene_type:complete
MSGYIGSTPVPQATQHRESFTATAGQTSFATAGYTAQFVDVYLNGVHLSPADVTATNGSDVVLAACLVNDIVDVISYSAFEVNAQTFTGTTTLTGDLLLGANFDVTGNAVIDGTALVTGVLTTTAATVFNGGFAANAASTISTGVGNADTLTLTSTDASASSGPNLRLYRNSGSPADDDFLGTIDFEGRNDNSQDFVATKLFSYAIDVSDGSEDAAFQLQMMKAGSAQLAIEITPDEFVINQTGVDLDFRVESDANANAFTVDAGNEIVGLAITTQLYNGSSGNSPSLVFGSETNASQKSIFLESFFMIQQIHVNEGMKIRFTDGTNTDDRILLKNAESVFNESSKDTDFRVESDADANCFVVNGGTNAVYVGSLAAPVVGTEKFGVSGGTASNSVGIAASVTHNTGTPLHLANGSNTTSNNLIRFSTGSGGDTRATITYNGSVVVYATSSDYRLKENINYNFNATEKLKQLKPAEYRWIESQMEDIGFIAHEVAEIVPNAVTGKKDAVDENGKIDPQGYDPAKLVPILIKTVQELEARITALES